MHLRDLSLLGADDQTLSAIAAREQRIIVTQDADFDRPMAGVCVLRLGFGNAPTAKLIVWLEPLFEGAVAHFAAGEVVVRLG